MIQPENRAGYMEFSLSLMEILRGTPRGATATRLAEQTGRNRFTVLHTLERLRDQRRVHSREKPRRIRFEVGGIERETEVRSLVWTLTDEGIRRLDWKPKRK